MLLKRLGVLGFFALMFAFITAPPAYAYLDPGSGSFIVQILLAGLMGAALMTKIYWARIKSFFGMQSAKEEDEDDTDI